MSKKVKWVCHTAVLTALLIVLQFVSKPLGQIVTGSCVNTVLAVSALVGGLYTGLTVAVLSPIFAFLLGIGPQLFPITPAIAIGNSVFVLILSIICKNKFDLIKGTVACIVASLAKFVTLNILVVQVLCRILDLAEKQVATFSTMFSWPQLVTALIGSALALFIVPRIKSAIK